MTWPEVVADGILASVVICSNVCFYLLVKAGKI